MLGDVDEPPEVGVVDGFQFDAGCGGQVLGGGDPFDLRFQASRAGGGPGREGGVDDTDGGGGQQAG